MNDDNRKETDEIGFIGLGAMGEGMVDNLLKAGLEVVGFDPREEALERLRERGGRPASSPADAADGAKLLILMVVNDRQVEAVLFGENGAAASLTPGAVVMMCSTVPADFTRSLGERLAERGIGLLDAPVSGGAVGARDGTLTIMASGSESAFSAAEKALDAMAGRVFPLGDKVGTGSSIKAVNQLLAGVNLVTAAEGMAFGVAQGADPKLLFEIIKDAAGGSWMFGDRVPHMLDDDYTPKSAVGIWAKDLGLVLDQAKTIGMPAPVTAAAHQVVMMAMANGFAALDDAALLKVYEGFTGAKVVPDDEGAPDERYEAA
ncbi:MAG: L-threonate dehydrogenase [Geminicoccaceae bacterium]